MESYIKSQFISKLRNLGIKYHHLNNNNNKFNNLWYGKNINSSLKISDIDIEIIKFTSCIYYANIQNISNLSVNRNIYSPACEYNILFIGY